MSNWVQANDGLIVGCAIFVGAVCWCYMFWAVCKLSKYIVTNEKVKKGGVGEQDKKESG